jgi:dimethylhistidine N-methyltransferase
MQLRADLVKPERREREESAKLLPDVIKGLHQTPKQLSPIWFYDERGSQLFDAICETPEYYLTRTELSIMRKHAAAMARAMKPHAMLLEYGSGTSLKTRILLDHMEDPEAYVPIDIAREHLLEAASALAREYSGLEIVPICADFTQPFKVPARVTNARRRVVYFPGSTIGNFERAEAINLLRRMRTLSGPNGAILIGVDLRKDRRIIEEAYNDAAGVTAEFNLNALEHLNRVLNANFDTLEFKHRAIWNEEQSRVEMHLISLHDQQVTVAGYPVELKKDEYILTEYSHKYTLEDFACLARMAELNVTEVWTDADRFFSVQLLEASTERGGKQGSTVDR